MYSHQDIQRTYRNYHNHLLTGEIIKKYSENKKDIRDVALENLDISRCDRVLDLGCGYGFFIEKLAGRIPLGASVTGIDLIENDNEKNFLGKVKMIGCAGTFLRGNAGMIRDMADGCYNFIIASYSLYFFPELIRDIARILSPDGVFLSLTHSKNTLREVLRHIPGLISPGEEFPPERTTISRLFNAFCLENGEEKLAPCFGKIEMIPYANTLRFPMEDIEDCITYLDKKRILLFKEITDGKTRVPRRVLNRFYEKIVDDAREKGLVLLTKDDAVFRAFQPGPGERGR